MLKTQRVTAAWNEWGTATTEERLSILLVPLKVATDGLKERAVARNIFCVGRGGRAASQQEEITQERKLLQPEKSANRWLFQHVTRRKDVADQEAKIGIDLVRYFLPANLPRKCQKLREALFATIPTGDKPVGYSRLMLVNLADLHRALAHDEMVPAFQPLVELRTGRLVGFEVLARWQHAELGLILPSNFIATAEEFGLIPELTDQVFRKAFRACRNLPEGLTLAVNVSATQLNDLSLPGEILQLTESEGFAMSRLHVEITESALLKDLRRAMTIADDLKRMGCRLSLDDFGTGYSSLAHLHALPFDQLKIDRSFVSSVTNSRGSRKIVAAIVGLGKSLGLETVAEGIETEAQADKMLELGCEVGQGYLYGRAAPAEKLAQMIKSERYGQSLVNPESNREVKEADCLDAMPDQKLSQLRAIYDGAPVGLCFLDMNLRHVSVNRKLADMNGTSIKAHIGQHIEEVMGPAFARVEPYLRRAMAGEAIRGIELTLTGARAGAPQTRMMASYEPAFDDEGVVIGVSVAVVALPGQPLRERSTWKAIFRGAGRTTARLLDPGDVRLPVAQQPK